MFLLNKPSSSYSLASSNCHSYSTFSVSDWMNNFLKNELKVDSDASNSNVNMYHNEIIKLLNEHKNDPYWSNDEKLRELQKKIEDMSMTYDEHNLYKLSPDLLNRLVNNDLTPAKEYLKNNLSNEEDKNVIKKIQGNFMIEGICI